jgi:anthranilate phosphoribosyltransferase
MREMLVFNTAVALHLLEDSMGMAECVERARGAVASGAGARVLHAG